MNSKKRRGGEIGGAGWSTGVGAPEHDSGTVGGARARVVTVHMCHLGTDHPGLRGPITIMVRGDVVPMMMATILPSSSSS